MENKIFEQMQKIVKEYDGKTRIILVDDSDRGIGKTFNLELVAKAYGCRIANKYSYDQSSVYLPIEEYSLRGRRKSNSDMFLVDEGYSWDEISLLKEYFHIPLALVNSKNLGVKLVNIEK